MANLKVSPDVDLLMQGTNKAEMQIAIGLPAVGLDGEVLTADSAEATGLKWATPAGDMTAAVYDPTTIQGDAFARANHTGTQLASTISDFDTEVSNNTDVAANTSKLSGIATGAEVNTINTTSTGEPSATSPVYNVVNISQVDYDAAIVAGSTVSTTFYIIT